MSLLGDEKMTRKAWRRSVRNYLFNEIGISREDVREMLREIIREEAARIMGPDIEMVLQRTVNRLIQPQDRYGRTGGLTQDKIEQTRRAVEKAIIDDAVKSVRDQLGDGINVSLTLNSAHKVSEA